MRFVVGVLACIGAGILTVAVADPPPPEQPAHAASSTSTSAPAAPAPSAPQSDRVAPAVAKPAIDPEEKHLIALGYKPEMRNGEKVFCRREQTLGSRLGEAKHCATAEQLKVSQQETHDVMDKIQRTQKNPQG
jgi:hypothetical protein